MDVVHKNTLVSSVTRELRRMIVAGEIPPGGFLPTRKELADRFGVGLSTVHEAIQALAAVGMVESHAGRGTWVRNDALDTLIHPAAVETRLGTLEVRPLLEARAAIEVALSELAAARATPDEVGCIWEALHRMEAALDDEPAFLEADWAFHLAVARAGHNELLEQFYHVSRKMLAEAIVRLVQLPNVKQEGTAHQRAIAEAIDRHDPAAARRAALAHMAHMEALIDDVEQAG